MPRVSLQLITPKNNKNNPCEEYILLPVVLISYLLKFSNIFCYIVFLLFKNILILSQEKRPPTFAELHIYPSRKSHHGEKSVEMKLSGYVMLII